MTGQRYRDGAARLRSQPPPTLPVGAFAVGIGGVSRPIEGLDSLSAAQTLRAMRSLANSADASRLRTPSPACGVSNLPWPRNRQTGARRRHRSWLDRGDRSAQARSGPVRAPRQCPQRSDGAAAVEALDGPRHAMYPIQQCRQRQAGQGLGSQASRTVAVTLACHEAASGAARRRCAVS